MIDGNITEFIDQLYYGQEIDAEHAQQLNDRLERQYPMIGIEVVGGNQPNYHYIASIE